VGADARVGDIVNAQLRQEVARDLQNEVISETRQNIMDRVTRASNKIESDRSQLVGNPRIRTLLSPFVTVTVDEDLTDELPGRAATDNEIARLEADGDALTPFSVTYLVDIRELLGIEIVDVRIKRADFPPDIETSVFSRMEAERERIASGLRAEGTQQDSEIRADVDRRVNIILETAEGRSALLRGEGEQEAIEILAESLEKNPEFYAFRRSLEAYKVFMDSQTTVILDPGSDLLKYLQAPGDGS
jgi:HflC protein